MQYQRMFHSFGNNNYIRNMSDTDLRNRGIGMNELSGLS